MKNLVFLALFGLSLNNYSVNALFTEDHSPSIQSYLMKSADPTKDKSDKKPKQKKTKDQKFAKKQKKFNKLV